MTWDYQAFQEDEKRRIANLASGSEAHLAGRNFLIESYRLDYPYVWRWRGFPLIQMPEDVVVLQEIVFELKPTVIIETGIAWGGGLVLYASLMGMVGVQGRVLGIDLHLDPSIERRLTSQDFGSRISVLRSDSVAPEAVEWVKSQVTEEDRVMVILDSHHSHDHVLAELRLYSKFVSEGQYLIAGDTATEFLHDKTDRKRPWGQGDNPHSAVNAFLAETSDFSVDMDMEGKLLTSLHPGGYLRRNTPKAQGASDSKEEN